MHERFALLTLIALFGVPAVARAQQQPSPQDYLEMTLAQNQMQMGGVVDPLVEYPFFTDADKAVLRKALKPMDDALAAMKKNAAANPSIPSIQADQAQVVQSSYELITLLNSGGRADFAWISSTGKQVADLKGAMLQDKPADFLALIKSAGATEAQLAKISPLIDQSKSDYAEMLKQAAVYAQTGDQIHRMIQQANFTQKTRATLKSINSFLTLEQRFASDWGILRTTDDPASLTLGFAAQPTTRPAPEAGTYVLLLAAPTGGAPDAQPLGTFTLKKGDLIGFKKNEQDTTAIAGDKTVAVSPDTAQRVYWRFSPAKP